MFCFYVATGVYGEDEGGQGGNHRGSKGGKGDKGDKGGRRKGGRNRPVMNNDCECKIKFRAKSVVSSERTFRSMANLQYVLPELSDQR